MLLASGPERHLAPLFIFISWDQVSFANIFSDMLMQHNTVKASEAGVPALKSIINNVHSGSAYLLQSSPAERPFLCRDRCWILALGTALSAEAESGHIGSWLPQFSFSLISENKNKRPVSSWPCTQLHHFHFSGSLKSSLNSTANQRPLRMKSRDVPEGGAIPPNFSGKTTEEDQEAEAIRSCKQWLLLNRLAWLLWQFY